MGAFYISGLVTSQGSGIGWCMMKSVRNQVNHNIRHMTWRYVMMSDDCWKRIINGSRVLSVDSVSFRVEEQVDNEID